MTSLGQDFAETLLDTAQVIILLLDCDGRIVRFNPYMEAICGYSLAEVEGKDWFDTFLPQRERARTRELFNRAIAGGQTRGNVNPIVTRSGEERLIEWFDRTYANASSGLPGLVAIGQDITERRRAEDALHEKEQFQNAILDSVFAHIAVLDRNGVIIAVNEPWLRFARENSSEPATGAAHTWLGINYLSVCRASTGASAQAAAEAVQIIEAVLQGRLPHSRLEYACNAPHEERWFVMRVTPLGGPGRGAVVAHIDITERKRAESALRQSEEKFRATFEQAAVGISHTDPQGRWLRVNRKLCEIVGYTRDELLALAFQDITYPPDLASDLVARRKLLSGEIETYVAQKRYIRKDGKTVWANLTVSLVRRDDGAPDYFIAVIEDIEERKRAEAALQQLRAEMEQLTKIHVASQTVAAIAHELYQPLNAIMAYSEAALRLLRAGEYTSERLLHALQGGSQQAQRAASVTRELLDLLAGAEVQRDPMDLNAAVRRALAIVNDNGYGGFSAVLDLDPGLAMVHANRLQVEKVLVNLLQNAIEAMRAGGVRASSVVIATRTVRADAMAHVTVRDGGPGLDQAMLQQIFEPFFTTKSSGLGMGLTISKAIIEANGGKLWAESVPGEGALFHFTLSLVQ